MANRNSLIGYPKEYSRVLPSLDGGFRGVDFSSSPHRAATYRLPDAQNVWRDYRSEEGGAVETIPGFRRIATMGSKINGIFRLDNAEWKTYIVVHSGTKLYVKEEDKRDDANVDWKEADGSLENNTSHAFVYNGVLYILDGQNYKKLTIETSEVVENNATSLQTSYVLTAVKDDAYVPKTLSMGSQYEQRNMLTDLYRMTAQGSDGTDAPEVDLDLIARPGGYQGKDTFVVAPTSGSYSPSSFIGKGISALALSSSNFGSENDISGNDNTITDLAIRANGNSNITMSGTSCSNLSALRRLYLHSNTSGTKILFSSGSKIVMKNGGQIFYNFALESFSSAFYSSSGDVEKALAALPPNIVVVKGQSVTIDDDLEISSPNGGRAVMNSTYSNDIWVNGSNPSTRDDGTIYIRNGDNGIVVDVGVDVPVGRYYFYGRVIGINGLHHYRLWRIEVVANATSAPKPVQDVFEYDAKPLTFNLPAKTVEVLSVNDDEFGIGYGRIYDADGNIASIGVIARKGENEITVKARAVDYRFDTAAERFRKENSAYTGESEAAIEGCTICAIYDDRIFLSGNPNLPNTVFYSQRNDLGVTDPSYFGVLNYFNDGVGWEPITGMFSFSDTLCVTKKDSVYYHNGADGDDVMTRIYPSVRGNAGLGSLGANCCFLDDPVMLTRQGVWGVNKETLTLERTLGRRSSLVDARLTAEQNLEKAEAVEWEGYMCLFVNGHVYMADSRAVYTDATGNVEYEWFYLSDVGVFLNEDNNRMLVRTKVYAAVTGDLTIDDVNLAGKTVTVNGSSYTLTSTDEEATYTDADVYTATYSVPDSDDVIQYSDDVIQFEAVVKDGKAYAVYETGEYAKTGTFYPAVHPFVIGDRLYFGTENGEVFVFNNDKRGMVVEGETVPPTAIHHSYYSFAGHRIDSGLMTRPDDCDIPHLAKSTLPASVTVRHKTLDGGSFTLHVRTDRNTAWRMTDTVAASVASFYGTDFERPSLQTDRNVLIVSREKEKQWVEKQYLFRDGGFCRPFGIYEIAYRYRIAGRIKE